MKRSHAGFTMIELMFVLLIIGLMTMFLIPLIWPPIDDAKIKSAVIQAQEIVTACNLVRVTPISSVRDPLTLKVTKSYGPEYSSWTDVSVLKSTLSKDYPVPTENPFGHPYYFKMSALSCSAAVEIDEMLETWGGYETDNSGPRLRIIVTTPSRSMSGLGWIQFQNRMLYDEGPR